MHKHFLATLAMALVPWSMAPCAENAAPPRGFKTPYEAYEAYRKASEKRDWHAVFSCLTPGSQDSMIVSTYYDWLFVAENPKVGAMLSRFRLTPDQVLSEYEEAQRRLDEKQGIASPAATDAPAYQKPQAGQRAVPGPPDSHTVPAGRPLDYERFSRIILKRVSDKTAFFAESSELAFSRRGDLVRLGALKDLRIAGETAIGRMTFTDYYLGFDRGEKPKKIYTSVAKEIGFRKINGRWFVGN
jgi:hypothetical protein